MKKILTLALMIGALALAGSALAQEKGGEGGHKGQGGGPGMRGQGGGPDMFAIMGTFRALRGVIGELDEVQKPKFEEAMKKMVDAFKEAQAQFETDLAGILSAEQMEKFKAAKEAPPEMPWGGRGGQRPEGQQKGPRPQGGGAPE